MGDTAVLKGEEMKRVAITVAISLFFCTSIVYAETIKIPCEEFNRVTGWQIACEGISGGMMEIERSEYEKYRSIASQSSPSDSKDVKSKLPSNWDINGTSGQSKSTGTEQKKETLTPELKKFYCDMPEWRRPAGLVCDK